METASSISIEQITYQLTWKIRHEVMWPNEPLDYVKLEKDPEGLHYGLFDHNRLWSVVSIFGEGDKVQFRKFATRTEAQGKGYGTALLNYTLEDLSTLGVKTIWCNARVEKTAFYQRFGLVATDETFMKNGQSYVIMKKELLTFNPT